MGRIRDAGDRRATENSRALNDFTNDEADCGADGHSSAGSSGAGTSDRMRHRDAEVESGAEVDLQGACTRKARSAAAVQGRGRIAGKSDGTRAIAGQAVGEQCHGSWSGALDHGHGAVLADIEIANGLRGDGNPGTIELEGGTVELDRLGIRPAALTARGIAARHVIDGEVGTRTQDDGIAVVAGGGIHERCNTSEACGRPGLESTVHFDIASAGRRLTVDPRAYIQREGTALRDLCAAGEVVGVADGDRAGERGKGAHNILGLCTHLQERRAGKHIVSAGEDQGIAGTGQTIDRLTRSIGIRQTRAESRRDVRIFTSIGEAACQEGMSVTDGGQVQGGVEERLAET